MSNAPIEAVAQPRIDTTVTDAVTGQARRRTEYSGVIWFGGRGQVSGRRFVGGGQPTDMASGAFIPDSLPYLVARSSEAVIASTIALQHFSDSLTPHILDHSATLAPDPRGGGQAWLHIQVLGTGLTPIALSYRIVVLVGPDAVATASPTP